MRRNSRPSPTAGVAKTPTSREFVATSSNFGLDKTNVLPFSFLFGRLVVVRRAWNHGVKIATRHQRSRRSKSIQKLSGGRQPPECDDSRGAYALRSAFETVSANP